MVFSCLSSMATSHASHSLNFESDILRGIIRVNNVCSTRWLCPRVSQSFTFGVERRVPAFSTSLSFTTRMRRACVTSLQDDQELEVPSDKEEEQSGEDEVLSDSSEPSYAPPLNSKLYVGNLPWSCDSEELAQVFQKVGSVEMVEVIFDRMTGRSRGFGFVTMSTAEDAQAAMEKLNGADYAGRTLRVNFPLANRGDPPLPRSMRPDVFDNTNKLFVGNIAWGVDDAKLEEMFSRCGQVVDARVVIDKDTGRSRGFGFVKMSSETEVNEALDKMDGVELEGRNLRVSLVGERPPARGDFI